MRWCFIIIFLLLFPLLIFFPETKNQIKIMTWVPLFMTSAKYSAPLVKDKQLWNPSLRRTGNAVSLGAKPILLFYSGVYFWSTSVDHSLWPHFALQSALTKFCWWTPNLNMSLGIVLHLLTGVQSLWSDQGKYKHPEMCRVNTESSVPPVLPCKPLTLFNLFM